jgi:hypothetical protein
MVNRTALIGQLFALGDYAIFETFRIRRISRHRAPALMPPSAGPAPGPAAPASRALFDAFSRMITPFGSVTFDADQKAADRRAIIGRQRLGVCIVVAGQPAA